MDFVEYGLGRYFFPDNWDSVKDKVEAVRHWLLRLGEDPSMAEKVKLQVDELRKSKLRWRKP